MKLAHSAQDVNVHGDFETSDFAVGDIAFIVDMFADKVYTHKERAIIRELACNAHDSHVLAKTTKTPFDVHLPTSLEPWFSLRDYGTGLSDSEIRTVFAGIGISTKRDSNEVIGCFGIGNLSPYSLTDSFTVKSYRDGVVSTYNCYRDEHRKPVVALLTELATNAPNGLEVSLSVDGRIGQFEREAIKVFKFWEGTLPNINNAYVIDQCQEQRDRYIFKGEDFALTPRYGSMFAVMGNISYAIPDEIDEFDCDGYLKFELGELEFDTARENLSMTDKVKVAIKQKFEKVRNRLAETAIQQIENEPTAFKKAQMAEQLSNGQLGRHIKVNLSKYRLPQPAEELVYWQSKYRGSDRSTTKHVPVHDNVEYYLHKDRMTTRLRHYMKDRDRGFTLVIFKDMAQVRECNVDADIVRDMKDIPKAPQNSRIYSPGNTLKTFKFNTNNSCYYRKGNRKGYWNDYDLKCDGSEIVYVEINRWNPVNICYNNKISGSNEAISSSLCVINKYNIVAPDVIGLKTSFVNSASFRKGNFVHLNDYIKREFKKIVPTSFYEYDKTDLDKITRLYDYIDHSEIKEIYQLAKSCNNKDLIEICKRIGIDVSPVTNNKVQDLMNAFNAKYPMLELVDRWEVKDNKKIISDYIGGTLKK